jgi:hypothetical protein
MVWMGYEVCARCEAGLSTIVELLNLKGLAEV